MNTPDIKRLQILAGLIKEEDTFNPFEESDDYWWYTNEGDGIDWDAIMDVIKAAANKVVGPNAPNRNSYFNLWYDVMYSNAETAWENIEDYDDDDEVFEACRDIIYYYTSPSNWEDVKNDLVYGMEEFTNIVANKQTMANLQKMGEFMEKALMTNHKPPLNEEDTFNPFEEADLSDYDEFLKSYIRICAKYFNRPFNGVDLGDLYKDQTLSEFVFMYLKKDAKSSQVDEPSELFDNFSEDAILKRIKVLANEA